jgi:hypothetical protein
MLEQIKNKALRLGATSVGYSKVKNKKYYVEYNDKIINFGSETGSTYLDHKDEQKRIAWVARHSKIKNKNGEYVYKLKESPAYWAFHLLWQ